MDVTCGGIFRQQGGIRKTSGRRSESQAAEGQQEGEKKGRKMPKDNSKPDRAKPRFITMEHNTSRGQHFLCNPLIVQVRHHAVPAAIVQTK